MAILPLPVSDLPTVRQLQVEDRLKINEIVNDPLPWVELLKTLFISQPTLFGKTQVKVDGDSLDYGYLLTDPSTQSYTAILKNSLLPNAIFGDFANYAVSGQTVSQMLSDEQSQVINSFDKTTYQKYVLVIGGGINDLMTGTSASDLYNNMRTYHQAAVAAGIKTIARTLAYGNKEYGVGVAACEVQRLIYNNMVRAGYKTDFGASQLVDLGNDAHIGIYSSVIDPVYYASDGQHWTAFCNQYLAPMFKNAIILAVADSTITNVSVMQAAFVDFTQPAGQTINNGYYGSSTFSLQPNNGALISFANNILNVSGGGYELSNLSIALTIGSTYRYTFTGLNNNVTFNAGAEETKSPDSNGTAVFTQTVPSNATSTNFGVVLNGTCSSIKVEKIG